MNKNTKAITETPNYSLEYDLVNVSCLLSVRNEFEQEGIRGLLRNRGVDNVKSFVSAETALKMAANHQPGVLIAVMEERRDIPFDLAVSIRESGSISGVILLSDPKFFRSLVPIVNSMSEIEGVGVKLLPRSVLKNSDRLMTAVDQVLHGHSAIEREVMDVLVLNPPKRSGSLAELLTKKELRVLEAAATGASNSHIGHLLGISTQVAGNFLSRIFVKLGSNTGSNTNRRVLACREYFIEYGYPI